MQPTKKEPPAFGRLLLAAKNREKNAPAAKEHVAADRKLRAKSVLKRYTLLLALGFTYLIFCRTTGLSLPCPFHAATGFDCPGCGITRLMLALAEGDLVAAFHANEAIFTLGPLLLLLLLRDDLHWILHGEKKEPTRLVLCFFLIAFAIFTLWRNFLR